MTSCLVAPFYHFTPFYERPKLPCEVRELVTVSHLYEGKNTVDSCLGESNDIIKCTRPSPTQKFFSKSCYSRSNLDCNYTFPIDSAPNEIPLGAITIQIWFGFTRF